MSGLGILASLVGGGGNGVSENAKQSIREKAKAAEDQRIADIRAAETAGQRTYADEQYDKQLADQKAATEDQQAFQAEQNRLNRNAAIAKSNSGGTKLSDQTKVFNSQVNDIIGNIEKTLTSSSYLDEDQRKKDLAYSGSQLDELIRNNPQYLMYDPENGIYHNPVASRSFSVLSTLDQMLNPPPPSNDQDGNNRTPFTPPAQPPAPKAPSDHNGYIAPASERNQPQGYQTAPNTNLSGNTPILPSLKNPNSQVRPPGYLTGG